MRIVTYSLKRTKDDAPDFFGSYKSPLCNHSSQEKKQTSKVIIKINGCISFYLFNSVHFKLK